MGKKIQIRCENVHKIYKFNKIEDLKLTKRLTNKWAQMRNENYHIEERISIAAFFKMYGYVEYFRKYMEEVRSPEYNYRPMEERFMESFVYCEMTHAMIARIRNVYGNEISEKVNECL